MDPEPHSLTATDACAHIDAGRLTPSALVASCLHRIEIRNPAIKAWVEWNAHYAETEAKRLDSARKRGPLHGIPFGIKDVVDALPYHTRNGSPLFETNRPSRDSTAVARLKAAGAVILGKTVTTEFATLSPGPTENPVMAGRSPGGSSSGSAAAVADFQVPIAIANQTASSLVRPAAYCGVYGLKPTTGLVPVDGSLAMSHDMDSTGFIARTADDIALATRVFVTPDYDRRPLDGPPSVGVFHGPTAAGWDPEMRALIAAAETRLQSEGLKVERIELGAAFDDAIRHQTVIACRDLWELFTPIVARNPDRVTESFKRLMKIGEDATPAEYRQAHAYRTAYRAEFAAVWRRVDFLLTPAALGPAPVSLRATGDPVCGRGWVFLALPTLACPMGKASDGAPLGLQVVGPARSDLRVCEAGKVLTTLMTA